MTNKPQNRGIGEEVEKSETACDSVAAKEIEFADLLPAIAIATRPPSNLPIGRKFNAFENIPVIPTATSG